MTKRLKEGDEAALQEEIVSRGLGSVGPGIVHSMGTSSVSVRTATSGGPSQFMPGKLEGAHGHPWSS